MKTKDLERLFTEKGNEGWFHLVQMEKPDLESIIPFLLDKYDINQKNEEGLTPLLNAILCGNISIAKILIQHGADVNITEDTSGYSPLIFACLSGDKSLIKLLLDNGAEISIRAKDGTTPLTAALRYGRKDICELMSDIEPDILTKEGTNALIQVSYDGNMDVVNYLLMKGVSINASHTDGFTSLMAASQEGHINIVKDMLKHGADINAKDHKGQTALMHAAIGGTVSFITEEGSPAPDENEIEQAISEKIKSNKAVVSLLIESGANIQEKDNNGMSALDHALEHRYNDIVKLLESSGTSR